jgi:polysaccharide pyruvyl transferase WcaK-like protein
MLQDKKNILVLGGYGYHNTGNEAQLAGNLNYLKKIKKA